jgi:chorismate synthase
MAGNSFGKNFRITTFGESHGPAIGVVIDGVPPRFTLDIDAMQKEMDRRRPGESPYASGRKERDVIEVISGLYQGKTTGTPLTIIIRNEDQRPEDYDELANIYRPGHADFTYQKKYGIRDPRGGGRASGRETAARVAAGAVAKQILEAKGISIVGHVLQIGYIKADQFNPDQIDTNPLRCADEKAAVSMEIALEKARSEGDSLGALVEIRATGVPVGLGDPVFDKLDARLAYAMMGIGAVKGVEIGGGFRCVKMRGGEHNDPLTAEGFLGNNAGGVLGGISSGQPLLIKLAVKPPSSIARQQQTIDAGGSPTTISIKGRHDPCIGPRLVPVAEAMMALVLADYLV